MSEPQRYATCARCRRWRHHRARGLCASCHSVLWQRGELDQHPRRTRTLEQTLEDYRWLLETGETDRDAIAARLGMTRSALEQALERARAAGEEVPV